MFTVLFVILLARWAYLEYRMFCVRMVKRGLIALAPTVGSSITPTPADLKHAIEEVAEVL
jgi:hypothetical protein